MGTHRERHQSGRLRNIFFQGLLLSRNFSDGETLMMTRFRSILAVLLVTIIATHPTFAGLPDPGGGNVPEIDPAMGMGAIAFLGGVILVIRGRAKL